jgi:hypothetical protein
MFLILGVCARVLDVGRLFKVNADARCEAESVSCAA